jgi:hypothetical protein
MRTRSSLRLRRQAALPLALVAAAVLAIGGGQFALSALSGSGATFHADDGDLTATGADDWNGLPDTRLKCTATVLNCGIDKPTGATDDSFGQGTSEDTAVPSVTDGSIPNNKSDLQRFYVAHEFVNSKNFLYLAWERVQNPSGTTNMDFELNQSRTGSSNGVTAVRTDGDLLINYDLSSGGSHPSIGYRKWLAPAAPVVSASSVCEASNKYPCWSKGQALDPAYYEGLTNTGNVSDTVPPLAAGNTPRVLSPYTFGEVGIDLNGAGIFSNDVCTGYGSAYLKSRSSDSFTAAIKDFVAPVVVDVNNCNPAVLKIKKVKSGATSTLLGGAVFKLYKDSGAGTGKVAGALDSSDTLVNADDATDHCTTTDSDGIGSCTYTLAATAATNGTYLAHEVTAPNGYQPAADQTHVVTISSANSDFTFEFQDTTAPGRVVAEKKSTTSTGAGLGGAGFVLIARGSETSPDATAVANSTNTCTTVVTVPPAAAPPDGQGTCSFESVALGDYWLVERTAPTNYFLPDPNYQSVTVSLGSTPNTGQTVIKTFVDQPKYKVITIVCNQATGALKAGSLSVNGGTALTTNTTSANALALCGEANSGATLTDKTAGTAITGISVTP